MQDGFAGLFDTSLLFTIGLVFLATLIGSYLRSRRKDPCLSSFEHFHVTLERTDDKIIWGKLEVESTGLELFYKSDVQDEAHLESSYILYGDEYNQIQAIYRYVDELTPENRKKRERDIEQSFHPGPWEIGKRRLRAFIGTANDSFSEVFGMLVGRAKKPAGRYITDEGESYLNELGKNLIGHAGGLFDPLLERYIGQKVVIEIQEGSEVHEHVGIFKEYSPDFLELLDVQFPEKRALELDSGATIKSDCVQVTIAQDKMIISNPTQQPVLIHSLAYEDDEELINVVVDSGESVEIFSAQPLQQAQLHVRIVRELDIIVPRTRCVVRHRAERFKLKIIPDIIFDVGFLLKPDRRDTEREVRLRRKLANNPKSALAAANLGMLLLKRHEYEEARKWLHHAYSMRRSLPDNGRRVEMELRELERRSSKTDTSYVIGSSSFRHVNEEIAAQDTPLIDEITVEPPVLGIDDSPLPSSSVAPV
ncbi:MAG: tetratricopeptide repeat protein [Caldilineaceae bacterium]|nr:tetratricopeptide repeat protein [Caldilineaceae bacterium]